MCEGRKPARLIQGVERNFLLSDLKARGVTQSWGSLTKSDDYIFDNIEMSLTLQGCPDGPKSLQILRQGCEDFMQIRITHGNNGTPKVYKNGDKITIHPEDQV